MKKIFIILSIYILHANFAIANTTIAFIDMDKIISTSKPGSFILSQLNDVNLKNSTNLENDAKKLKKQETKLMSQKKILSEIDFKANVNKLKLEFNNFNANRDKISKDFNNLRIKNINKLMKLINPILINYSNDNSISMILKKKDLVIGKSELDITDEIIIIINRDIKQFKIK
jgi:outer membrane protein